MTRSPELDIAAHEFVRDGVPLLGGGRNPPPSFRFDEGDPPGVTIAGPLGAILALRLRPPKDTP
jgi:hypothetical protein